MTRGRHCEVVNGALVHVDGELTDEEREVLGQLMDAARKKADQMPREDCRYCATSYDDCTSMRKKDAPCCDRCKHPVVHGAHT